MSKQIIKYTKQDFERIKSNYHGQLEYHNGEIIFKIGEGYLHDNTQNTLKEHLISYFDEPDKFLVHTDDEIVFKEDDELYIYKPDVFVTKASENRTNVNNEVVIIFEILSNVSAEFDYTAKLSTYERFGVKEFNIVARNGFIQQYYLINGKYSLENVYHDDDNYTSIEFPDFVIPLKEIFK